MESQNVTTQDDATRRTDMVLSPRQEKLQTLRDELAPGERPAPIVPRTFAEVNMMCEALARADLAPKHLRGKAMDMTLVVMTGLEVGLPPMASLRLYTTWDGVPRLMAEGVRAVILQSPMIEYFEMATCDDTQATWVGKRCGRPEKSVTWTIERARKAGLTAKENWLKYAQDMLNARASMQLGRILAPDVIAGMVSLEEARDGDFIDVGPTLMQEFGAPPAPGVAVGGSKVCGVTVPIGGFCRLAKGHVGAHEANPQTARAESESSARSTTPPKNSEPSGSPTASAASSKLDAAIGIVEGKSMERPTPAASASTPSPHPSASTSPAVTGSSSTVEAVGSSQTAERDRWGQPIGDPTSGGGSSVPPPTISDGSAPPSDASAGEFGGGGTAEDAAVAEVVKYEAWLASCMTFAEMQADFQRWSAWSRKMADEHNDERFRKKGELTTRMATAWARRKAELSK